MREAASSRNREFVVPIHSDLRAYVEPRWMRRAVERLLTSLPAGYYQGLSAIVFTEAVVARNRRPGRRSRRDRRGTALGRYHRAWNGEAPWIELVVDEILTQLPRPFDRLPVAREMVVGRVLFHEIGHHLDATLGSVGRTGERGAEAWEDRLSRRYLRKRYGYLRPLAPVFKVLARALKGMAARRRRLRETG
jgi:hypothetical protein